MKIMAKVVIATAVLAGGLLGMYVTPNMGEAAKTTNAADEQNHQQTIKDTVKLAKQGKTINSEKFGVFSKGSEIRNQWGQPDQGSDENYFYYSNRQIGFVLKQNRVVWITSYDKKFNNITVPEVKKAAGEPQKVKAGEDAYYLEYKKGIYVLEFAFYYDDQGEKPETLKEVYVHLP
ncbi:MAG: DUF4309 domain-containing protein [Thermoactinomyces sp.]